jgi:hypothetical protein
MVLVGIYSSAISVSQNVRIRTAIRKLVENRSNLLDSIGATQMSRSLENEVIDIYNSLAEEISDDLGVAPTLSPIEAKRYCDKVIEELENSYQTKRKT